MTDYEKDFRQRAQQLRLRLFHDEDGTPVVRPRGKIENVIKIAPYGVGRHEISFMAETTRQLSAYLAGWQPSRCPFWRVTRDFPGPESSFRPKTSMRSRASLGARSAAKTLFHRCRREDPRAVRPPSVFFDIQEVISTDEFKGAVPRHS